MPACAGLDDGRSIRVRPSTPASNRRPSRAAVLPLNATPFRARRQAGDQRAKVGGLGVADGLVQTAGPLGAGDDVPQADAGGLQGGEALGIGQGGEIAPHHPADQPPEQVSGVSVILLGSERGVAWQAAKDEDAGVRVDHRREGGLAGCVHERIAALL